MDALSALLRQMAIALEPWIYRLAGYLVLTMMDDPAMLAMWFF